jgi:hypothetical protein
MKRPASFRRKEKGESLVVGATENGRHRGARFEI